MFYLHGVGYGVLNNVSSIRFTYSNTGTQTGCLTMYLACTVLLTWCWGAADGVVCLSLRGCDPWEH